MEMTLRRPQRGMPQRLGLELTKYWAVLRISVASNLAYSMEVFLRALLLVVLVFVLTQLWKTTFALHSGKLLSGFSIADMVWYLVSAEMIAMSLPALSKHIDQDVRSGQLAYLLCRPCTYILYSFASYLGERLVRLAINGIVGVALALIMVGPPHFAWQGILCWPLAVFLAVCIEFAIYFSIGLLAFWTEETQTFAFIISRLTLVLGGVLAPLEIFPPLLRSIAQALPFSTILYGPARTLVHFEASSFVQLLVQQGLTLLVIGGVLWLIYRVAIRRVNINGG